MFKRIIGVGSLLLVVTAVLFSFQNCGQLNQDLLVQENTSSAGIAGPIALSSDVTKLQMKITSNDEMELEEGEVDVSVDLDQKELAVKGSGSNENYILSDAEIKELTFMLRLIRRIKVDPNKCKKMYENRSTPDNEEIIVDTAEDQGLRLGGYKDCIAKYDLALEERKVLKRILFRMITKRSKKMCLDMPSSFRPECLGTDRQVPVYDANQCVKGYKCVSPKKQCNSKVQILPPDCPANTKLKTIYKNGCPSGFRCEASPLICPMLPMVLVKCEAGSKSVPQYNDSKCLTGYKCVKENSCPVVNKEKISAQVKRCKTRKLDYAKLKNANGCVVGVKCTPFKNYRCPVNVRSPFDAVAQKNCLNNGGKYVARKDAKSCVVGYSCIGMCPQMLPSFVETLSCNKKNGYLKPILNANKCVTGFNCVEKKVQCRRIASALIDCKPGYIAQEKKDSDGCTVGSYCVPRPLACPPIGMSHIRCPATHTAENITDSNGCTISKKCVRKPSNQCPPINMGIPLCKNGVEVVKDENGCVANYVCKKPVVCEDMPHEDEIHRPCVGGTYVAKKDQNGCVIGSICKPLNRCPSLALISPPSPNFCKAGEVLKTVKDPNGCFSKFECVPKHICKPLSKEHHCGPNQRKIALRDKNRCIRGYRCYDKPKVCAALPIPPPGYCPPGQVIKPEKNANGCVSSYSCQDEFNMCPLGFPSPPECKPGYKAHMIKSKAGCFGAWKCSPFEIEPHLCPMIPMGHPTCRAPSSLKTIKDKNQCTVGFKCVAPPGVNLCKEDTQPSKPICRSDQESYYVRECNGWTPCKSISHLIGPTPPVCKSLYSPTKIKCEKGYFSTFLKECGGWTKCEKNINVPLPYTGPNIPKGCTKWYDGCNTCGVVNGKIEMCTELACKTRRKPYCLSGLDYPSSEIPKDCKTWYDGCNNCSVVDGRLGACTERACVTRGKPYCSSR